MANTLINRMYSLYTWGPNSYGQLGTNDLEDKHTPNHIRLPSSLLDTFLSSSSVPVRSMIGGGGHTFICTDTGHLYAIGWNDKGQLGLGDTISISSARLVESLAGNDIFVAMVTCGWAHSLAITANHQLLSWGCNQYGQLGRSVTSSDQFSTEPQSVTIPGDLKVIKICAGMRHSVALTSNGSVFTWGVNRHGQLGLGESVKLSHTPTLVPGLEERIVDIATGQQHTVLLTATGVLYTFGNNKFGQCLASPPEMIRHGNHIWKPTRVQLDHSCAIQSIHSGWSHVMAIMTNGDTVAWGRNDYGQLGIGTSNSANQPSSGPTIVQSLHECKQLSLGAEHAIAID
eukprot:Ihof_evm5s118 gene=Ihof_evmTU5s118